MRLIIWYISLCENSAQVSPSSLIKYLAINCLLENFKVEPVNDVNIYESWPLRYCLKCIFEPVVLSLASIEEAKQMQKLRKRQHGISAEELAAVQVKKKSEKKAVSN